jgi:hypothetical protein
MNYGCRMKFFLKILKRPNFKFFSSDTMCCMFRSFVRMLWHSPSESSSLAKLRIAVCQFSWTVAFIHATFNIHFACGPTFGSWNYAQKTYLLRFLWQCCLIWSKTLLISTVLWNLLYCHILIMHITEGTIYELTSQGVISEWRKLQL